MDERFTRQEVEAICREYGITVYKVGEIIDSSRGDEDRRYACKINDGYMLKLTNASPVNESFLKNIASLTLRYRKIGVYCPLLVSDLQGTYAHTVIHNGVTYTSFLEEFAIYSVADLEHVDEFTLKKEAVVHLGKLAAQYTGIGLVENRSMWTILDTSPWDSGIDEKQENLNALTECLQRHGFDALAEQLCAANEEARAVIRSHFHQLPRCVYQGDLNATNLLVDEQGHFKGLIDFNMFGTEVNINCFLNECTWDAEREAEEDLGYGRYSAQELFNWMCAIQDELMEGILEYYELNETEQKCLPAYRKIILMSMYPNVIQWKYMLEKGKQTAKVCDVLKAIAEMPLQIV